VGYLAAAVGIVVALALLNRWGVYRAMPYALLGIALWACVHAGGLHATLAGVLLALFIPTRPPPNLNALTAQANAVLTAETTRGQDVLRHGPSEPALRALDAIHDRLESPAQRTLRAIEPWSSFVVLPVFALCNAGVAVSLGVFAGHEPLIEAIVIGLVLGKPVGFIVAPALAVWAGIAVPSRRAIRGGNCSARARSRASASRCRSSSRGRRCPTANDFAAAKVAVFAASIVCRLPRRRAVCGDRGSRRGRDGRAGTRHTATRPRPSGAPLSLPRDAARSPCTRGP
jgi:NhaA family Na+:H+ antiporter